MHRWTFLGLLATTVYAACDFDQLHNPQDDAGPSPATTGSQATGDSSSSTSGGGNTTSATGGGGGSPATTTSSTTAGPTTTGAGTAGSAGAGSSTGGAGPTSGAGGTGGSAGSTATGTAGAGGSGGSGTGGASTGGAGGGGKLDAGADSGACAGYALEFDGTGGLAMLNRSISNDFTIEAWIKTSATSLTGTNFWEGNGLIYADAKGKLNDFSSCIMNGKFAFGVGNPDTTIQSTTTVTSGQWVHVAATRTMSTGLIQVLVNGTVEAMQTPAQTSALTASPTIAFGADTIDGRYFNGMMDEVRLWSVVRTPEQIVASMHQRLTGTETGLVGYYRFDEATGTTVVDSSPTKGNASLTTVDGGTGMLPKWVVSDAPICP